MAELKVLPRLWELKKQGKLEDFINSLSPNEVDILNRAVKEEYKILGDVPTTEVAKDIAKSFGRGVVKASAGVMDLVVSILPEKALDFLVGWSVPEDENVKKYLKESVKEVVKQVEKEQEEDLEKYKIAKEIEPELKDDIKRYAFHIGANVLYNLPPLAIALATRSPIAGFTSFGVQTYLTERVPAQIEAEKEGKSPLVGELKAIGNSLIEMATEAPPYIALFAKTLPFLKRYAGFIASDVIGEQLNNIGSNALDNILLDKDKPLTTKDEAIDTLIVSVGTSAILGGGGLLAQSLLDRLQKPEAKRKAFEALEKINEAVKTESEQEAVEKIKEAKEDLQSAIAEETAETQEDYDKIIEEFKRVSKQRAKEQLKEIAEIGKKVKEQTKEEKAEEVLEKEEPLIPDPQSLSKEIFGKDLKKLTKPERVQLENEYEARLFEIANEIANKDISEDEKFKQLEDIYNQQLKTSARTLTKITKQQFSTPLPIAYLLGKTIGIDQENVTVYEPTAGNGLLLTAIKNKDNAIVNELDKDRFEKLKRLFKNAYNEDATTFLPPQEYDRLIANPPFGRIKSTTFKIDDKEIKVNRIDHLIILNALKKLKPDGKAGFIIGGHYGKDLKGNKREPTQSERAFLNFLYRNYKVRNHVNVSGDLYKQQGTTYPIQIIVVDGKRDKEISITAPDPDQIPTVNSYEELRQILSEPQELIKEERDVEPTEPAEVREQERDRGRDVQRTEERDREEKRYKERKTVEKQVERDMEEEQPARRDMDERKPRELDRADEGRAVGEKRTTEPRREREQEVEREGRPREDISRADIDITRPAVEKKRRVDDAVRYLKEGKTQIIYQPISKGPQRRMLTPIQMAQAQRQALTRVQEETGKSIDEFVAEELGYSVDELHTVLSAEQIDAIALALYNLKKNKGFILGDMTGAGKGRVLASIIRWAKRNNIIPVFFTERPNLFMDMVRDLNDIKSSDIKPYFIADPSKASFEYEGKQYRADKRWKKVNRDKFEEWLRQEGYNVVFTVYSQIRGETAVQQDYIENVVQKNKLLILDESHNASGDSRTGNYIKNLIDIAQNRVVYSSATYAKRPDNLPLYKATDLSNLNLPPEELMNLIKSGGVGIAEVIAENLTKTGQYIRRELDFSGVEWVPFIDTDRKDYQKEFADKATSLMRRVAMFQIKVFRTLDTDTLKKIAREQGAIDIDEIDTMSKQQLIRELGITPLFSTLHNYISDILLIAKLPTLIDRTLENLKQKRKVVIALHHTKESSLRELIEFAGLKEGDLIKRGFDFVIEQMLKKAISFRGKDVYGKTVRTILPLDVLPQELQKEYSDIIKDAKKFLGNYPLSPIDYLRNKLDAQGVKVGELTGRNMGIDYTDEDNPKIIKVDWNKQRVRIINDFNNTDDLNVLIINEAGATGISLHASEKFKNKNQRVMLIAQPHPDINKFVQTLGRIHRTGQVKTPRYELIQTALPPEIRFAIKLNRKMKLLNANTSADAKGRELLEQTDIINKYGDKIAEKWLNEADIDTIIMLGYNIDKGKVAINTTEVMNQLLGRLAILSTDDQERIINNLQQMYEDYVEELKDKGEYNEETDFFDFKAERAYRAPIYVGSGLEDVFNSTAYIEKLIAKVETFPYKLGKIRELISQELGIKTEDIDNKDKFTIAQRKYTEKLIKLVEDNYKKQIVQVEGRRKEQLEKMAEKYRDDFIDLVDNIYIGGTYFLNDEGQPWILLKVSYSETLLPYDPQGLKLVFALPDHRKKRTISGTTFKSKITSGNMTLMDEGPIENWNDMLNTSKHEIVAVATGNIVRAFQHFGKGRIIIFSRQDGTLERGLLLPKQAVNEINIQRLYKTISIPELIQRIRKAYTEGGFEQFVNNKGVEIIASPKGIEFKATMLQTTVKELGNLIQDRLVDKEIYKVSNKWVFRIKGDVIKNKELFTDTIYKISNYIPLYFTERVQSTEVEANIIQYTPKPAKSVRRFVTDNFSFERFTLKGERGGERDFFYFKHHDFSILVNETIEKSLKGLDPVRKYTISEKSLIPDDNKLYKGTIKGIDGAETNKVIINFKKDGKEYSVFVNVEILDLFTSRFEDLSIKVDSYGKIYLFDSNNRLVGIIGHYGNDIHSDVTEGRKTITMFSLIDPIEAVKQTKQLIKDFANVVFPKDNPYRNKAEKLWRNFYENMLRDITLIEKVVVPPQFSKRPSIRVTYEIWRKAQDYKNAQYLYLYKMLDKDGLYTNIGKLGIYEAFKEALIELDKRSSEIAKQEIREIIRDIIRRTKAVNGKIKADRIREVALIIYQRTKIGPLAEKILKAIAKKHKLNKYQTEALIKLYSNWLDVTSYIRDRLIATLQDQLEEQGFKDIKSAIKQYKRRIGYMKYYFPRYRESGSWAVRVFDTKEGRVVHMEMHDLYKIHFTPAKSLNFSFAKQKRIENRLRKKYPDPNRYIIEWTPEFHFNDYISQALDPFAIESLINATLDKMERRADDPKILEQFRKKLYEQIANQLKSRGFLSHTIRRSKTLIEGYETEKIDEVISKYFAGFSGYISKVYLLRYLPDIMEAIPKENFEERRIVQGYIENLLRNETVYDRVSARLRSLIFLDMLGAKLSFAFVNLSQTMVTTVPYLYSLSQDIRITTKAIAKAIKTATKLIRYAIKKPEALKERPKNVSKAEWIMLKYAVRSGMLKNQVEEYRGRIQGRFKTAYDKFLEFVALPASITEQYNRLVAFFAYVYAQNEIVKQDMDDPTANAIFIRRVMREAEAFTFRTQFDYMKGNLPLFIQLSRGWGYAFFRTAYVFRHYIVSLINLWTEMGLFSRGTMLSIGTLAVLGGLSAIPFFFIISDLWERETGVPLYIVFKKYLSDLGDAIYFGIPAFLGISLSSQVQFSLPFLDNQFNRHKPLKSFDNFSAWALEEILGATYGFLDTKFRAVRYLSEGDLYRAVENGIPLALGRYVLKAVREVEEGVTTGRSTQVKIKGEDFDLTVLEGVAQAFGFTPLRKEKYYRILSSLIDIQEGIQEKREEVLVKIRKAKAGKDQKEYEEALKEVVEFNRWLKETYPEYYKDFRITRRSILRTGKERKKRIERKYLKEVE